MAGLGNFRINYSGWTSHLTTCWHLTMCSLFDVVYGLKSVFYYRPQRSLGQGNIFTSVCQEFCPRGEVSTSVHAGIHTPWQTPPWQTPPTRTDRPSWQTPHRQSPSGQTSPWANPPSDSHCSGRYAPDWKAFLFSFVFIKGWFPLH